MTSDFPKNKVQDSDGWNFSKLSPDKFSEHQATFVKASPESTTYQDLYTQGDGEYELRRRSKVSASHKIISIRMRRLEKDLTRTTTQSLVEIVTSVTIYIGKLSSLHP